VRGGESEAQGGKQRGGFEQRHGGHPEGQEWEVVSSEFPFTTKAGTATNNSAAQSGCGEKRRARDHMAQAAISENSVYAA